LIRTAFLLWLACFVGASGQAVTLSNPGGAVQGHIVADVEHGPSYTVLWLGRPLASAVHMGLRTQGKELGAHATAGEPSFGEINEQYPFLGAKGVATNHARTMSTPITETDDTRKIPLAKQSGEVFWMLLSTSIVEIAGTPASSP
jgi:hypothetical protein